MPPDSQPEKKKRNSGVEAYHPLFARTGIGYDSHRFEPPGPLTLGGVRIPFDLHLHGHSDGDAVCHALTDAGVPGMRSRQPGMSPEKIAMAEAVMIVATAAMGER